MGLFDLFKRKPASTGTLMSRVSYRGMPPSRGVREIIDSYRTHPWAHAVASRIADAVASVPWHLYVGTGKQRQELASHPYLSLWIQPNPYMTDIDLVTLSVIYLELPGECFWVLERNAVGQPIGIYPVPPHWIMETPSVDRPFYRVSHETWQGPIPAADVIYLRHPNPLEPYRRGVGTGLALADEIDTDEYAAKHTKAFFSNSALAEAVVTLKGATPEQVKQFEARFRAEHGGFLNAHRNYFTNGDISVGRLDTSFRDMQLVELRKQQRDFILQAYGVPPEVFGIIENSNRATIDAADFLMGKHVVLPRLTRLQRYRKQLLAQFDPRLVEEFENPVPADKDFQLKVMTAQPAVIEKNEFRELAGLPRRPELDGQYAVAAAPVFGGLPALSAPSDPPWARSLRPQKRQLTMKDLDAVLKSLDPELLSGPAADVLRDELRKWGEAILAELGADAKLDALLPRLEAYLREFIEERIGKLVNETTQDRIREEGRKGVELEETDEQIADRIDTVFDEAIDTRSASIARTEVPRATSTTSLDAYKASGKVSGKTWVTQSDGDVRPEHAELNGVTVELDARFTTAEGHATLCPGRFGDPALDCECRCYVLAQRDETSTGYRRFTVRRSASADELATAWRAYDAALVPIETRMIAALRKGFRAQQRAMREALENQ